jgi:hypothetical protein
MPLDGSAKRFGQPHTPAEDAELLALRRAGRGWDEIARLTGRSSASTCAARWRVLREKQKRADDAARLATRQRERNCMTCRTLFMSQHNGNRMCGPCREIDVSPFEDDLCARLPAQ